MITEDLSDLASGQYELLVSPTADIEHILSHTAIDEPTGTWTGGACARHGLPMGSDVALADLGAIVRQADRLADFCWYPPQEISALYVKVNQDCLADASRVPHEHELEWWQDRIAAVWSAIWQANVRCVHGVIERPVRQQGGDGFVVASFEHNSSDHGLERPHVHNLVPMKG